MASTQRLHRPDALFAIRAGELIAEGDAEQAVELCRRGLVYYPDNPGGYTMLASAYLSKGEHERARLVLWDGYRRTGAASLHTLAERIEREEIVGGGEGLRDIASPESVERAQHTGSGEALIVPSPTPPADVDADEHASLPQETPKRGGGLALHVGGQGFRTRSSNLRLIPGLEFAPLRHGDAHERHSIAPLMNERIADDELPFRVSSGDSSAMPPPFPSAIDIETPGEPLDRDVERAAIEKGDDALTTFPRIPGRIHEMARKGETLTPLEELARRLESARIPSVDDAEQRAIYEPSIVSDTIAAILVKQGAYAEALKAYQTLARIKPEKLVEYQAKITKLKGLIAESSGRRGTEQPG